MEPRPRGYVVEVSEVAGGQGTVQNLTCSPGTVERRVWGSLSTPTSLRAGLLSPAT